MFAIENIIGIGYVHHVSGVNMPFAVSSNKNAVQREAR